MILDAQEKEPSVITNAPKIPGYTILSRLGQGGMATVYLAIQESFGRKVALKVMMPRAGDDPQYGDRFIREAKIVANLSHPHIVPVYDVGKTGDYHYISMEFLESGDLSSRIKKVLTFKEIISITKDIALALDYAHRKGIIHRDVKPDNIMFREDGAAVLTDFGIARPASPDTNMTQVGKVIGTPKYMSPEQTKGETLDHTCDIYALGIMLFEMLTGNVPFDGRDPFEIGIKHLKDPVPQLPSSTNMFQSLVDGLLTKNRTKRIQSGQDAIQILEGLQLKLAKNLGKKPYAGGAPTQDISDDKTQAVDASKTVFADAADHTLLRSFEERKNMIVPAAIGFVLLILVAGGASVWMAPSIAPDNTTLMGMHDSVFGSAKPAEPVVADAAPVVAPAAVEPAPAADPNKEEIEKNLNAAAVALKLGNYVTPAGESALAHYQAILTIDANNQDAKLGIADLGSLLVSQANEQINAGGYPRAKELLGFARTISPNIPGLVAAETLLKEKENPPKKAAPVEVAAKPKETKPAEETQPEPVADSSDSGSSSFDKVRITGLLAKAGTFYSRGDFYTPAGENALDKYLAVLAISPNHAQARQGVEKIVVVMVSEINSLLTNQEGDKAKALYDKAIKASPNNRRLLDLGNSKGW